MTRRFLAACLTAAVAIAPLAAQDAIGTITGRAVDEARRPYSNFSVQVRDVASGQVVQTVPLSDQGAFNASKLPLGTRYLVELADQQARKVVCSEGPYQLASPNALARNDVNIDCGVKPAALWVILAGAGTATAIAITQASPSQ
jgi:hypothetical protein